MATPRFLIAKYVPDLRRMEPRNIGVVVWSEGNVAARFVGEHNNGVTKVIPPKYLHVNSKSAYRKWVSYWRTIIKRPALPDDTGKAVDRREPEFVELIRGKSKQQYQLVDGGELMTDVLENQVDLVADELFNELVAVEASEANAERSAAARELWKASRAAVTESGLREHRDFSESLPVPCHVEGTVQTFVFDYALYSDRPRAIMSKVYLWKAEDVYANAFAFREMQREFRLPKEQCASFIYPTSSDLENPIFMESWKMLDHIGIVMDMRDIRNSASRLRLMCI